MSPWSRPQFTTFHTKVVVTCSKARKGRCFSCFSCLNVLWFLIRWDPQFLRPVELVQWDQPARLWGNAGRIFISHATVWKLQQPALTRPPGENAVYFIFCGFSQVQLPFYLFMCKLTVTFEALITEFYSFVTNAPMAS